MKKSVLEITFVYILVLLCDLAVSVFNQNILMTLPLLARMLCMPLACWLIALPPLLVTLRRREACGPTGQALPRQFLIGIAAALAMSVFLTLLPHLIGLGELVGSGIRWTQPYQYIYNLFYFVIGVGASEEFTFRGYFYERFQAVFTSETAAVIGSSVLFGLLHIFSGNIIQVFMTMLLGALFCLLRLKVQNCSLLSLMIAHGLYDYLIRVWSSVLPN